MTTQTSYLEEQPFLIRVLRSALESLQQLLPGAIYGRIFSISFTAYRTALRALYVRHWIAAALSGDRQGRLRAARVHRVMPHSLVGARGLENTYDAVRAVDRKGVKGCIVELGVAQGGAAALMGLANSLPGASRPMVLFDSFEGLPEPTDADFQQGRTGSHVRALPRGSCLGTYAQVERLLFEEMKIDRSRVRLVKGWFEYTVPVEREKLGPIAVLRIDADWYNSVKCSLENLYDLVSPGGYVVVDDYGTCFGAKRAVDEFLAARALTPSMVHDGRGGCQWVKQQT